MNDIVSGFQKRFHILAMIALGTMINYLDRAVLGIAAPGMATELHISPAIMGMLFAAFSWSYVLAQIPGGWVLDRIGTRSTYFLAVFCWSLFTLGLGFGRGVGSLLACLIGLGICEAPCFPTNARIVTMWFPDHERARATAVYTVGEFVGPACIGPGLFWICQHFGWRYGFTAVGVTGVIFSLIWFSLYREPNPDDSGIIPLRKIRTNWRCVRQLLTKRQLLGAGIGQFAGTSTLVFFLTWFPTYLTKERHMDWMKAGVSTILPFLCAAGGILVAGSISDALLKRTGSRNLARKLPIIFGLFGASTMILANYVSSNISVVAIFSFAFFCQGMTGLCWALVSDISPKELAGLTGGIFNLAANLGGVVSPIVVGAIFEATGSFVDALLFVGGIAILGALSYLFILGDVKRIVLEPA